MQAVRNCGGDYISEDEKKTQFPPHHLGGTVFEWECPTSSVPERIKNIIELFFICYIRIPGFSGWYVQRQHLPTADPPLEQDHWTMQAFAYLEFCFLEMENDMSQERQKRNRIDTGQKNATKRIGR